MYDYILFSASLNDGAAAAAIAIATGDSAVVQDGMGTPLLHSVAVTGEKATYAYLNGKSPAFRPNPVELPALTSLVVDGLSMLVLTNPTLTPNDTIICKGLTT